MDKVQFRVKITPMPFSSRGEYIAIDVSDLHDEEVFFTKRYLDDIPAEEYEFEINDQEGWNKVDRFIKKNIRLLEEDLDKPGGIDGLDYWIWYNGIEFLVIEPGIVLPEF